MKLKEKSPKITHFLTPNPGQFLLKNRIFRPLKGGQNSPKSPLFIILTKYLGLLSCAKSLRYKGSFFHFDLLELGTCFLCGEYAKYALNPIYLLGFLHVKTP